MVLCHKWYVKNYFACVLQFFSLISDGLGSVTHSASQNDRQNKGFMKDSYEYGEKVARNSSKTAI